MSSFFAGMTSLSSLLCFNYEQQSWRRELKSYSFQLDDSVCRAERDILRAEARLEELVREEEVDREGGRRTQVRQGRRSDQ